MLLLAVEFDGNIVRVVIACEVENEAEKDGSGYPASDESNLC